MGKHLKKGSAVILALIIMTLVIVLGSSFLYNAHLMQTLALERSLHKQHYHAAHALLAYGIAHCKELDSQRKYMPQNEKSKKKTTIYTLTNWLDNTRYTGVITIEAQNDSYIVSATLSFNEKPYYEGISTVSKSEKKWHISDQQIRKK